MFITYHEQDDLLAAMRNLKDHNKCWAKVAMLTVFTTILYSLHQANSQVQDPPSVYLSLRGTNYFTNNSDILITDIGETKISPRERGDALACNTDLTNCCRETGSGGWLFSSGEEVSNLQRLDDIYRNRGPQFVALNRRNNATQPTGLYCCQVPDASGETQTFCANIVVTLTSPVTTEIISSTTVVDTITTTGDTMTNIIIAAGTAGVATFIVMTIIIVVFIACCLTKHRRTIRRNTRELSPTIVSKENSKRQHPVNSCVDCNYTQEQIFTRDENELVYVEIHSENIYDYAAIQEHTVARDLEYEQIGRENVYDNADLAVSRAPSTKEDFSVTKCVAYGQFNYLETRDSVSIDDGEYY